MMSSGAISAPTSQTQSTATVFEYGCLYTHNIQRKQKRWQDGKLRFHSFNRRIMVHDLAGNFIGDMHWRESENVQEGDELRLDRGILIQVGEAEGHREQDLTEILDRKKSTQSNPPNKTNFVTPNYANSGIERDKISHLKPKSLNAVLGTPRGIYGRALLPSQSPFQDRQKLQGLKDDLRPTKRQKPNVHTPKRAAKNINNAPRSTGPPLVLSGAISYDGQSQAQASSEVINISSDDDAPERPVRTKKSSSTTLSTMGTAYQPPLDRNLSREPLTRPPESAPTTKTTGRLITTKTKRNKLMCLRIPPVTHSETLNGTKEKSSTAKNQGADQSRRGGSLGSTIMRGKPNTPDFSRIEGAEAPGPTGTSSEQTAPSNNATILPLPAQGSPLWRHDDGPKRTQPHSDEIISSAVQTTTFINQRPSHYQSTRLKRSNAVPILPHRGVAGESSTVDIAPVALALNEGPGPWSREAFDLFGWTTGSAKGVEQG